MSGFDRRYFLGGAASLAGALSLPRTGLADGGKLTPTSLVLGPADTATIFPMVALEGGFAKQEGLDLKITVTDAGVQTRQTLAAGQTDYAIGDTAHPLQLTNRGKASKILFVTATFPTTSNMVVRSDLYAQGITSPEAFANWKKPGGAKPVIAATQIGASTWTYGSYIFEKLGLAQKVNWVAGGGAQSLLGGLKSKQFDAIMAQPGWMFEAVDNKWGNLIFDPLDRNNLDRIFGGPIPVGAVIYALQTTIKKQPDVTQAMVNAIYRAAHWIKAASVDDIFKLVGPKYLGEGREAAVKREITYYKRPGVYNYNGFISADSYARAAPVWFREGTGISKVDYDTACDFSFLQNTKKKLG
ncbi:MAG TPA: ABC transporter substrate-binding protein [Stellaceae bacterium]|jgi:NitT/TauT family transport system substrate-binding protein|nr:ABC transporter substrate-binding protein [Stellaceae bacterium]